MVSELLGHLHPDREIEIVTIKTSGDKGDRDRLGAFVREIQQALLDQEIDLALHCLKDLPTQPIDGLSIAAHLEREDARDALITRGPGLRRLPPGSVIGTGSIRRTSQLAALRTDFRFKPLVGNVDTRLRKLLDGEYDAIVLAMAGLKRLGVLEGWSSGPYGGLTLWPMSCRKMVPCAGQAVLVLESRSGEEALASELNHLPSERAARAERAYLHAFGSGCSVPVGAYAEPSEFGLTMSAWVGTVDGLEFSRMIGSGPIEDPEALARDLLSTPDADRARQIVRQVLAGQQGGPA